MKFKVGDKVRRVRFCPRDPNCCPELIGKVLTISKVDSFDGRHYLYGFPLELHCAMECELEQVNQYSLDDSVIKTIQWPTIYGAGIISNKPKQTITMKISNAFKKFLNADLQTQIKAGFRDNELALTAQGKEVLLELMADSVADKFTAAANEIVAEQEKTK